MRPVIAIIGGTGKEGPGLAMRWAAAGYNIIIGSRQQEKAQATADTLNKQLGLDTIQAMENTLAVQQADICVLTVEQSAHHQALQGLVGFLDGKILVDATARVLFQNPEPPPSPAAARYAQDLCGSGVKVVAAFQNVPAHVLKKSLHESIQTDVLVCSDDLEAASAVIELAKAGGMQAYYAGGLDNAVVVEGLTALLISINKHYGIRTASISITGVPVT